MSSDDPQSEPTSSDRRDAVREKAQLVQARQSRARLVRTTSLVVAIVAVVAVVAVTVAWVVGSAVSAPQLSPSNVVDGGIVVTSVPGTTAQDTAGEMEDAAAGDADDAQAAPSPSPTAAVVDIRIYVDYLSPGAKQFQLANATQLGSWISQGAASVTYFPVAMLTSKSNGTKYSLRAASAAACVATYAPDSFFSFTSAVLDKQPDIDADGLTDTEIADIAIAAGADSPKQVRACIESDDYTAWAKAATESALQGIPDTDGIALTSSPMVLVNGQPYLGALDDPAEFSQFVLTIASARSSSSPSPSPTATETPAP